ncbi:sarcosine oxidase subunit delta [Pseudomonas syringae]|uniref:sarcosine oxidase subunit delta n=1 Tax=Pseudomonas syringae TaxID=317 RepID=UPI001F1CDDA9|nr:sarcosine oxidase subunit delta [Pseudomonas syringae]MCF5573619.1 sarcosine oxidase subunit delta [Pseudomonas syringae]
MKIMTCPLNGPRNISEFTYGGEFKPMPDPQTCSDNEWADYVFNSEDTLGVVCEWWMHNPSSSGFPADRHTGSSEIIPTFDPRDVSTTRAASTAAPAKEIAG